MWCEFFHHCFLPNLFPPMILGCTLKKLNLQYNTTEESLKFIAAY